MYWSRNRKKNSYPDWTISCMMLLICVLGMRAYGSDGKGPETGMKPLDENGKMQISSEDRCPVCGMRVIKHPQFACAIQLKDRTTYYFCGTGCMIRSWLHPEIFLGKSTDDLKRPVVREYFTGKEIDARDLIFVTGSDIIGPMGPALVPVKDIPSLKIFKKRHGGKDNFQLNELTDDRWMELTGRKAGK